MKLLSEVDSYRIIQVYGHQTPNLEEKIITFWLKERALMHRSIAQARLPEVIVAALNPQNELVGVNSGHPFTGQRGELKDKRLLLYRHFIRPRDRNFWLMLKMFNEAETLLKNLENPYDGVLFNLDNTKFNRRGFQRRFDRKGWLPAPGDPNFRYRLFARGTDKLTSTNA